MIRILKKKLYNNNTFPFKIGAHDRRSPDSLVQQMRIKKITLHEQYGKSAKYDSDIALIELEEPVRLSSAINTICLPSFVDFERPDTKCM